MTQPIAIIIAGLAIAAAIAVTHHWDLHISQHESGSMTVRLNRWTGAATICSGIDPATMQFNCSSPK